MPDFQYARERLEEQYKQAEAAFYVDTRPVESTVYFVGAVGSVDTAKGTAILRIDPQKREPFGYGKKDNVPGLQLPATDADTSLDTGTRTPKGIDYAVEGFSAKLVQCLPRFKKTDLDPLVPAGVADADRLVIQDGGDVHATWADPGAIWSPPQCDSPVNLESVLLRALGQSTVCTLKFDSSGDVDMGTLDGFPSGPDSYLRANGAPSYAERYGIREGYIWRGEGTDSRLSFRAEVVRPVLVPIFLRTPPESIANLAPTKILIGIKFRCHGVGFRFASVNT